MNKQESFNEIIKAVLTMHKQFKKSVPKLQDLTWDMIEKIYAELPPVGDDKSDFLKVLTEILLSQYDFSARPACLLIEVTLPKIVWQPEGFAKILHDHLEKLPVGDTVHFLKRCVNLANQEGAWDQWLEDMLQAGTLKDGALQKMVSLEILKGLDAVETQSLILSELLEENRNQLEFWEFSEVLRKHSKEKWLTAICDATSYKDRFVINPVPKSEAIGQEIIRMITKYSCSNKEVSTIKRTIIFFCELTSKTPRLQLLTAWKALDASGLDSKHLEQLSNWFDDELPNRKAEGSVRMKDSKDGLFASVQNPLF